MKTNDLKLIYKKYWYKATAPERYTFKVTTYPINKFLLREFKNKNIGKWRVNFKIKWSDGKTEIVDHTQSNSTTPYFNIEHTYDDGEMKERTISFEILNPEAWNTTDLKYFPYILNSEKLNSQGGINTYNDKNLTPIKHIIYKDINETLYPYIRQLNFDETKPTTVSLEGKPKIIVEHFLEQESTDKLSGLIGELIIPAGVENICVEAFERNKFTKLHIPDSVNKIGEKAFYENKWVSGMLKLPKNLIIIEKNTFGGMENIDKLIINDKLEIVKEFGFGRMKGLNEVIVPENVKILEWMSFNDCGTIEKFYVCEDTQLKSSWNSNTTIRNLIKYKKGETPWK